MCSPLCFWVSFLFYFEGQVLFGFLCFHFLPFFSSCLEYCLDRLPCCPSPCWCVVTVHLTVSISQWVSVVWVHFGPHPFLSSSLCYFRVFKALFFVPGRVRLYELEQPDISGKEKKTINETAQPCQTELVTMVIFLHIFCHTQPWVSYLHFWYKCYKWVTDRSSASPPQTLHSELLPTCVRFLSAQTTNKSNEEFSFCTFVTSVYDRDVFAYVKEHVCVHKSCTWRLFFLQCKEGSGWANACAVNISGYESQVSPWNPHHMTVKQATHHCI